MSVFLAVFLTCGTYAAPAEQGPGQRVCIASVLHAIQAPKQECELGAAAEANAAELRLIKGGFRNTTNQAFCYTLSDEAASDDSLLRYMRDNMGGQSNRVLHFDFHNGEFVRRDLVRTPQVKGRTL